MRVHSLYEHPLKSGRGDQVESAVVRSEGLARDRRFLVHTTDGTFVSGRSHPRLVLIRPRWDGSVLTLSAPGCPDISLSPREDVSASVAVWRDRFSAWDQGEEPARWLSDFLGDEVRLAWLGDSARRLRWDRDRRVTFADAAPLLLISTASLAELSARVGEPLAMRRFRPNLVIEGSEPFAEDGWRRIRVGEIELLNADGCGRCEFTTIDPETGERHPLGEPVTTLETFRRTDTGIYFGMNAVPLNEGVLRVGDPVEVLETRRPLFFGASRPLDAALDRWRTAAAPAWPEGEAELVCLSIRDEAPGVRTFTLTRSDGKTFTWEPGQYVTLRLELPEGPLRRSYSISSVPHNELFEITVKRVEDGRGSLWLHEHLRPGATVAAERVDGAFTLAAHPWDSLLFLGAGSGMTPLMAMARFAAAHRLPADIAIHQTARHRADLLFDAELRDLAEASDGHLTYTARVSSDEGRPDHQNLVTFCPDLRDRRAFVCGPPGYRAHIREVLSGIGFKVDRRYHEELFGEAALELPDDAEPGTVTFVRRAKSVPSDGRTTLLQLAERTGVDLPSSCRSGDCGTCRVKAGGVYVLACHTFPRGDLEVDL
jgi:uncharacterized protein YcbX/ferredoxin-NADP reductase